MKELFKAKRLISMAIVFLVSLFVLSMLSSASATAEDCEMCTEGPGWRACYQMQCEIIGGDPCVANDDFTTVNSLNELPGGLGTGLGKGGAEVDLGYQDLIDYGYQIDVLANDVDPDGLPLQIIGAGGGADIPEGSANEAEHGSVWFGPNFVYYIPDVGFSGEDSFHYAIRDFDGYVDIAFVYVTVEAVYPGYPVAVDDEAITDMDMPVTIDVLRNDYDTIGMAFSIFRFTDPSHGSLGLNKDATFTYTPDPKFSGSDSFTYTIIRIAVDAENGLLDDMDTATVRITVAGSGNNPPVANDDYITIPKGGTANILTSGALSVLENDIDPDGDPLITNFWSDGPDHASSFVLNNDGTFNYTHDGSDSLSDSFNYAASDGDLGDEATVHITITDSVVINDDYATVGEDSSNNQIDVLANDSGFTPGVDGNIAEVWQPSHGTVTHDGQYVYYTPDAGYTGSDSFEYDVDFAWFEAANDGPDATVYVEVTSGNSPPVAYDDYIIVIKGRTATILKSGETSVLANDTDPDGDPLSWDVIAVSQLPAHGTLLPSPDGTFVYTHDGSDTTSDSFEYCLSDGNIAGGDVGTVHITIVDAVIAVDDNIEVEKGGTVDRLTTGAFSVLDNDINPDNMLIASIIETAPSHGNLIFNNDGTFTYTHDGTDTKTDSFTYHLITSCWWNGITIADMTATVHIKINGIDTPTPVPEKPLIEAGVQNCYIDIDYSFLLEIQNYDAGNTKYFIDWDEGDKIPSVDSDEWQLVTESQFKEIYRFTKAGVYDVRVGIYDPNTVPEPEWSRPLPVKVLRRSENPEDEVSQEIRQKEYDY